MRYARAIRRRVGRALLPPPRGVVLLYHRVARPSFDPWGLAVAPERFAEHVDMLAERFRTVTLASVLDRPRRGRGTQVAVTFDDGYADNLEIAQPRLEAAGLPATYFISGDGSTAPFWWDALAARV